jgi:hypothetical protein
MLKRTIVKSRWLASAALLFACGSASAANAATNTCANLPNWSQLQTALSGVISAGGANVPVSSGGNGGFGLNMWATIVGTDGTVCAVAFSGANYQSQWLESRVISAQKAYTANGLSLSNGAPPTSAATNGQGFSIATANLYSAVQQGGSLYGLQFSNPVDPEVAYDLATGTPADPSLFGTVNDPMVGRRIGGVNVFGGGLALYSSGGVKIGAVGVSGDTSCTDHFVAWRTRHALHLDKFDGVVLGPNVLATGDNARPDNIVFDIPNGAKISGNIPVSPSGWGHPLCFNITAGNEKLLPTENSP